MVLNSANLRAQSFRVGLELEDIWLDRRLKPVETCYDRKLCCMEGTRRSILNQIVAWVAKGSGQKESDAYWIYGLPGIGKTSLAHSICERLDKEKQLVGGFFCRRGDSNMGEPRNILPTLIYKLAIVFPPFRIVVAKRLRDEPNLAPKSMQDTLILELIRSLPHHLDQHTLVFVIDALDECGNTQSRPEILRVLRDASVEAPWLKIIVTSRPEVDIMHHFLNSPAKYDLGADQTAPADLQTFARHQFSSVASKWHLPTPWPDESLLNRVISQANGLFIFVKTLVLALLKCGDPEETLKETLEGSAGNGLEPLYNLYSSIVKAHSNTTGFWRMIVVITTAQHRSLCKEPIARLAGVKPYLVETLVDDLSSLLYRDQGVNGGIRVRHLSIYEFFVSGCCDYQANLQAAHMEQGIACLKTMIGQLRFNICNLEDSRLANADVKDLQSRIEQNISDPLQYSCLYWSNHISVSPSHSNHDPRVLGNLKEFLEGLYPLFWIEVLSIMGMVPIGAPSLRRVISWAKVSTCH